MIKMKIIFYSLLFSVLLSSCNGKLNIPKYHDAPTQFIVKKINVYDGMVDMCVYTIEVIDANGITRSSNSYNLEFDFCDTINKYKLGQPIHFDKNR